jgi:hypothetical protein
MPPSGAFLYAMEYTGTSAQHPDFPPRPNRFRLTRFANDECMGPSYALLFRDAGRFFQIHVYFGKQVGPTSAQGAFSVVEGAIKRPRRPGGDRALFARPDSDHDREPWE